MTQDGPVFPGPAAIERVINDRVYRDAWPLLRSFAIRGRDHRNDPSLLLNLQVEMVRALLDTQDAKVRYEAEAQKENDSNGLAAHAARVTKRIAYLIRQIADGIAWRLFDYDRLTLYQLALKPHTGDLQLEAIASEVEVAERHAQRGEAVLLNDLTNFVRYGDVTVLTNSGPKLIEVKSGTNQGRGSHASRQSKKLESVADFLNSRYRETAAGVQRLVALEVQPRSHTNVVSQLISEARRKGKAYERLSDSVALDVFHLDKASTDGLKGGKRLLKNNPFSESATSLVVHSLEFFHHFTRNRAPYSIFPLSDEDCSDILTGLIWVVTYFNWGRLERSMQRRNLAVQHVSRDDLRRFNLLPIGEKRTQGFDIGIRVSRPDSRRTCAVSFAEAARLMYEFLDEQCLVDAIEEIVDAGVPDGEQWFTAFQREHLLWN